MTIEDPLWLDNGTADFSAREDRRLIATLLDPGVVNPAAGACAVTERAAGPNMTVDVAAGETVVPGTSIATQGSYLTRSTGVESVTITPADPSNPRIDRIVSQLLDSAHDGGASDLHRYYAVPGTPAPTPSAPALPPNATDLATVTVGAGATSIVDANIVDVRVAAQISAGVSPIAAGTVASFAGDNAPAGWLLCDGRAVSRTTYARLFAAIDVKHGAGDGSTTFGLPDCRGRVPLGLDNLGGVSANRVTATAADTVGGTGGTETVALTTAQMPTHTHTGPSHTHTVDPTPTVSTSNGSHAHSAGTYTAANVYDLANDVPVNGTAERARKTGRNEDFPITGVSGTEPAHAHTVDIAPFASAASGTAATGSTGSSAAHPNTQPWIAFGAIIKH